MRNLGLLAGLAAILAALVLAGGEAMVTDQMGRANVVAAPLSLSGTMRAPGFFAGAGLTSPL